MKIFKTMVIVDGAINQIETIEYEGYYWLVPDWLVSPDGKQMRPLRIISLATIPHTGKPEGAAPHFVVSGPVPKSVFDGVAPKGQEALFRIVEQPQIVFPNPSAFH